MKKVFRIALIFQFTLHLLSAQEIAYRFELITMDNGLSSNSVYSLLQDKKGFLWVGTLDGLDRYDGYDFIVFQNEPDNNQSISNNRAAMLYEDNKGYIWISGKGTGIDRYDPEKNTFKRYSPDEPGGNYIPENNIWGFFENNGKLILKTNSYTCLYNYQDESFSVTGPIENTSQKVVAQDILQLLENRFNKPVVILTSLFDRDGNIWLGLSDIGLVRINPDQSITYFSHIGDNYNDITAILQDNSGIIWIGKLNEGLYKYVPSSEKVTLYQKFENEYETIDKVKVRTIAKDFGGNIWIGTSGNGVIKFNRDTGFFAHYIHSEEDTTTIPHNKVRTVFTDRDGNVWIGSYNGLSKYDPLKDNFQNFYFGKNNADYRVYNIKEDSKGNLWIANWENLVKFSPQDKSFKIYSKDIFGLDNIRVVFFDKDNFLWLTAEFGGLARFNIQTETVDTTISYIKNQLPDKNVFHITEGSKGLLWIATFNGLCSVNRETKEIVQYNTVNGLPSNMTYGTIEDRAGNLWVPTSDGLAKIVRKDNSVQTFNESYGFQSNEFYEGGFYVSEDKSELIVGGADGFNIFNPESIQLDTVSPKIVITQLLVSNKPVAPLALVNKRIILDKDIIYTDKLKFNRLDKIFSFDFAALHFKSPETNQYAYKMEGFDNGWIETNAKRRFATYTNLDPGKYTFRVKASNCDGKWTDKDLSLKIIIKAPFWKTIWFYILVAGVIFYTIFFFIRQREKQAKEITRFLEQKVKEGEEVVNQKVKEVNEQKEEIEKRDFQEKETKYFNEGLARLGDIIGKNNDNIDRLCKKLTNDLIEYIGVEMVNIYVKELNSEQTEVLIRKGVFLKDSKYEYLSGEGIPGACYQTNKPIIIDNLPTGERRLISGLGETSLTHLVALPISLNGLKTGVLEIVSLDKIPDFKLQLLQKLVENLSSTIEYIKSNQQASKLLEDSKLTNESLKEKEEELRQNLEELSAIQETSALEKEKLTQKISELEAAYNALLLKHDSTQIAYEALQQISQHIQVPLCIRDLDDNIIFCNESFFEKLGIDISFGIQEQKYKELSKKIKLLDTEKIIQLKDKNGQEIGEIIFLA